MCNKSVEDIPTVNKYSQHLEATAGWLMRSIVKNYQGSCAHFSPILGWFRVYPETTGYLIPTLLKLESWVAGSSCGEAAVQLGQWLLKIQLDNGAWQAGL